MGLQIVNFGSQGIYLDGSFNRIGGDRSMGEGPIGQGNLFSYDDEGIRISLNSEGNVITGNLIGTDQSGSGIGWKFREVQFILREMVQAQAAAIPVQILLARIM